MELALLSGLLFSGLAVAFLEEVARPFSRIVRWVFWLVVAAIMGFFIAGCTGRPISIEEMAPRFNESPLNGIVIVEGSSPFTFDVLDQAGRKAVSGSDRGTTPIFYNGRRVRVFRGEDLFKRLLGPGDYTARVRSYFWATTIFGRYVRETTEQEVGFEVTRDNPSACKDYTYTRRSWGWCLELNVGDVPQYQPGAISFPMVDIRGTGIIERILNGLGR